MDGCSCAEGGDRVHEADQDLRQGRLGGVHPHDWQASRLYEMGGGSQGDRGEARRQVPPGGPGLSSQWRRTSRRLVRGDAAIGGKEVALQDGRGDVEGRVGGQGAGQDHAHRRQKGSLERGRGTDVWACIELPEEDYEEGKCGRLRRWLYGMRPAAKAWEDDYAEKLESIGFLRWKAAPTVFRHPGWKVRVVVHGDDFTVTGKQQHLDMVKTAMREWYIITVKGVMGPDAGDCKDMCILNRRLKVEGEFLIYEPDPKLAKILCEEMGLKEDSKGLGAPVAREDAAATGTEEEPLGPEETTRFRALSARANYIAQDRADVRGEGAVP